MPENHLQNETFSYRDVVKMSELTGSSPIFVDAVETFKGGPAGGQTRVTLRNEHLSYIITWYTLSGFTSLLWYRKFIMRKSL
ncbi:Surfeit locus protein 1 [Armadillidium nasatum]|uniref:SURF1-like protein n=1 Tax=Armadillidium nasatum TaxID=96803 RepID=A0A5N5TNJ7_9CRUS|nr:Surfeit locus protein 1 [Armadillidium nasatum]